MAKNQPELKPTPLQCVIKRAMKWKWQLNRSAI